MISTWPSPLRSPTTILGGGGGGEPGGGFGEGGGGGGGVDGFTVTVVLALPDPPLPLQARLKVEVMVSGPVDSEPLVALLPLQAPEALQLVALVLLQVKVLDSPLLIVAGEAERLTVGAGFGGGGGGELSVFTDIAGL